MQIADMRTSLHYDNSMKGLYNVLENVSSNSLQYIIIDYHYHYH